MFARDRPKTKVYIDVSLQAGIIYEGRKSNVLTASLTLPGHPELAAQATMSPFGWESLGRYHQNGAGPPGYSFDVRTTKKDGSAVVEIVEPAEQGVLTANFDEILSNIGGRRNRAVAGIAHSRSEMSLGVPWQSLYDVEVRANSF